VKTGSLEGALKSVFDTATDYFAEILIKEVVWPIARALGQAIASQLGNAIGGELGSMVGGALGGPIGALIGGLLVGLVGGLVSAITPPGGATSSAPIPDKAGVAAATRAQSSAPSITYHAETTVNVELEGGLSDPVVRAQIRALAEEVTVSTLRRLGVIK